MADPTGMELKRIAQEKKKKGDLEGAATTAQQAIDAVGPELAELYGILGGIRKLQGRLSESAAAYDAGFRLDSHLNAMTSYNELNRLVIRIMLCPGALSDPELMRGEEALQFVDLPQSLVLLKKNLQKQVEGARSDDYWAAGDLALIAALNGELAVAKNAVQRFVSRSPLPPAWAYDAYIRTFAMLGELDTPCKKTLLSVKAMLEGQRPTD